MSSNEKEPKEVDWLIMLYMAGDNNLNEEMVLSLQFLLEVGGLANDAIVAEFDSSQPGRPTKRYDFTEQKGIRLKDHLAPEDEQGAQEASTGNPETLESFLKWAEGKYKPQHRILILSGHGSGTTEDFLMRDENADDFLSMHELTKALEKSGYKTRENSEYKEGDKKLDIIGMDACYMSMAEVCYELREHADILIGAEGLEPEFGWPYSKFLRRAYAKRTSKGSPLNPDEVAIILVKEYIEHYEAHDQSVDLAAIRLSHMKELKQEFGSLVTALNGQMDKYNKLTSAHWRAQTYKSDQFVDLKDLCDQIDHVDFNDDVERIAEKIVDRLEDAVLLSGCTGFAYQWSHGLSVYFPWAFVSPDYGNMSFAQETETGWDDFIKNFVKNTRRDPRYKPEHKTPPMSGPRKDALAEECGKACAEWATRAPFLKPGRVRDARKRLTTGGAIRARRFIEHYEADGVVADEIVQELRSDVAEAVGYVRGGRHNMIKKYNQIKSDTGFTRDAADRGVAIKNLAPVTGVAWWPLEPDVRIVQVGLP
jgi:hypothetical protein